MKLDNFDNNKGTPSNATNDIPIEVPERSAHGEK